MIDWKSIRAAVFDLDGTLIDSARIWQEVDEIFFARRGMAVPPGYAEEIAHLGFAESAALTVRRYLPSERAEEVVEEWRALSLSRYRAEEGARYFKPGAIRLVSRMREAGLRLCVATASLPEFFRPILRAGGIESLFDDVVTVADAGKVKMYMKNFGEFYNNQIEHASTIILSRTQGVKEDKLEAAVALLREHNAQASIITTPWDQLTGKQILAAMEQKSTLQAELEALAAEAEHEHHHHDHEDGECCCHDHDHDHEHEHHHHDHEDGECCCHDHDHDHEHEHHHHDHEDGECCCHDHDHDHEHEHHHHDHEDGECSCGHHHDHHHHHADEVFTSFGRETTRKFTDDEILHALEALDDGDKYGVVLRAKGIVQGEDGQWIHFDYVPGAPDVRHGSAEIIGRLCVIGSKLNENAVAALFGLN